MLSRKFKASLIATALFLTLAFVYVISSNSPLSFLELTDFTDPIWKVDLASEYYVISAQWAEDNPALKTAIEDQQNTPLSKGDLKDFIKLQLQTPNGDFLKNVEEEVRTKYIDENQETLKQEVVDKLKKEATEAKFDNDVKSYKVDEELRAAYLQKNGEQLRNSLLKEYLKDTTDEALKAKLQDMQSLGLDKKKYFQNIFTAIFDQFSPSGQKVKAKGKTVPLNGLSEVTAPTKSRNELTNRRVRLKPEDFDDLQKKHDAYVAYIRSIGVPPMELCSGNGIMLSAGRKHVIGALNVIVQLRELGSELPIELVLDSKDDYSKQLCEITLPKLNAKCMVIEEMLGQEIYAKFSEGFPMKAIALVLSSFDNTIYLDSDNFPIQNPDLLFLSEPFLETRFILWPDNWHKGTSPLFYDIARLYGGEVVRRDGLHNHELFADYISRDKNTDVLFHDLDGIPPFRGVESGQLVFSKRERFRSLLLALYYNLHGTSFYYPLLYQGVYGVGDRETFVPALHVMNEQYYLTDWPLKFSGLDRAKLDSEDTYFDESTMIQQDPAAAYTFKKAWRQWLATQNLDTRLDPFQNGDYTRELREKFFAENSHITPPDALFLHVHSPKINSIYNEKSTKAAYDYHERYIRKIGEYDEFIGTADWELRFQAINAWSTCEGLTDLAFWGSFDLDQKKICSLMQGYVEELKKDTNDVGAAELKYVEKI